MNCLPKMMFGVCLKYITILQLKDFYKIVAVLGVKLILSISLIFFDITIDFYIKKYISPKYFNSFFL